jgi:hypothetical protein
MKLQEVGQVWVEYRQPLLKAKGVEFLSPPKELSVGVTFWPSDPLFHLAVQL